MIPVIVSHQGAQNLGDAKSFFNLRFQGIGWQGNLLIASWLIATFSVQLHDKEKKITKDNQIL